MSILGTRVVRTEDPRLLTTGATYVEDLRLPELEGAAYVTFVRSPMAHARITEIDVSAATDEPGVVAVFTAADFGEAPDGPATPGCWPATWSASPESRSRWS
jgi:aerobic carbon-monoxide dehydrogenase large subunit